VDHEERDQADPNQNRDHLHDAATQEGEQIHSGMTHGDSRQ
jgi:hypothetical protein